MRYRRTFVVASILVAVAGLSSIPEAKAVKPFKDEFVSLYVKADSNDPKQKDLSAAVEKAGCAICHQGESKKKRNAYGKELAKLLQKKDKDNKDKIRLALEKVATLKSQADNPAAPTFGERIQQGKLPVE